MASTELTRTFSSGNRRTFTFSAWIKASQISSDGAFFQSGTNGSGEFWTFNLQANGGMYVQGRTDTTDNTWLYTSNTKFFRDPSAWQHWVVAVDTTQSTESDRVKVYKDGTQFTDWESPNYPSQNYETQINSANSHAVGGRTDSSSNNFDGSMAHIHFIDGTAYAPTTFAESDSVSGTWKPKTAPSVTYGTNGFFLKFENSGAMGTDSSGNSNTFTVSGTLTQNVDTPSNNFATINPLYNQTGGQGVVLANGNTRCSYSPNSSRSAFGTIAIGTGKYYFEAKLNTVGTAPVIGIVDMDWSDLNSASGYGYHDFALNFGYDSAGGKVSGGSSSSFGDSFTANDIIGVAIDKTNNKLYFSKNGVWQNSGDPTSGATGTGSAFDLASDTLYTSACRIRNGGDWSFNFGQGYFGTTAVASAGTAPSEGGIFEYDCPSGYQALCTKGINSF